MTIGSLFLGLALLVLVGLFVARPLLKPDARSRSRLTRHQALVAQKEAVLAQIKSLDFDHDTGKLTDEDYHKSREEFLVMAEDIFRQLDELEQSSELAEPVAGQVSASPTTGIESEIEAAVALHRAQPSALATAINPSQSPISNGKTNYCPECGQPTNADDKFCANCGHKLHDLQHA